MSDQLDEYVEINKAHRDLRAETRAIIKQAEGLKIKVDRNKVILKELESRLAKLQSFVCPTCKGDKKIPSWHSEEPPLVCPTCQGSGEADRTRPTVETESTKENT